MYNAPLYFTLPPLGDRIYSELAPVSLMTITSQLHGASNANRSPSSRYVLKEPAGVSGRLYNTGLLGLTASMRLSWLVELIEELIKALGGAPIGAPDGELIGAPAGALTG